MLEQIKGAGRYHCKYRWLKFMKMLSTYHTNIGRNKKVSSRTNILPQQSWSPLQWKLHIQLMHATYMIYELIWTSFLCRGQLSKSLKSKKNFLYHNATFLSLNKWPGAINKATQIDTEILIHCKISVLKNFEFGSINFLRTKRPT